MARYNQLSKYRTTWEQGQHGGSVTYVSTRIVAWDAEGNVTLNSGGWETVTTKRKMSQAAWQFGLGYGVHQRKHVWYVSIWSAALSKWVCEMPFHDGMTFNPRELRLKHNEEMALA
jgi:hypothetical protein